MIDYNSILICSQINEVSRILCKLYLVRKFDMYKLYIILHL